MAESIQDETGQDARALVKKLDAVGWGIFFIWIGIASLADVGWGAGLLGVGVITLGTQAARKYYGFPVDRLWLVIGSVFAVWGVLELFKIQLGGALLIIAGIVIIVSALRRKPKQRGGPEQGSGQVPGAHNG